MMCWIVLLGVILATVAFASSTEYQRELRYLEYYLGIKPHENPIIETKGSVLHRYVSESTDLNCDVGTVCSWHNAHNDGVLDTCDFYRFTKSDDKAFPVHVQPGNPYPPPGSSFLLAGNTTKSPNSAIFVSAPIACQRSPGRLTFKYWLYGDALLEVVLLKPANTQRRQLQVLSRPISKCNALRPRYDLCRVTIPEMNEPFRIGIRALRLGDESVGSFAMIANIEYRAELCIETSLSKVFGGRALPMHLEHRFASTASEYSCADYTRRCRWANSALLPSKWKVSNSLTRWNDSMGIESHPSATFFYQSVDSLTPKPYALFQSDLIQCTSTVSSLTFRYWLKPHTQVQICSVTGTGIVISCAYLSEADSPGPIVVDVDAPSDEPFRFVFEIIEFDRSTGGIVVVDDLDYSGTLCNEPTLPPTTTINPQIVSRLFALRAAPPGLQEYTPSLGCDFEIDFCPQWQSDGKWKYGVTPSTEFFDFPSYIAGNVAVALMNGPSRADLTSRVVPCARRATVTVYYYCSEHANLLMCVGEQCEMIETGSGQLSIDVNSESPFRVSIIAESEAPSIAVVRKIQTSGYLCPLPSLNQLACTALNCEFDHSLCEYTTPQITPQSPKFELLADQTGVNCVIEGKADRCIVRSPRFELTRPVDLEITLYQSTFGSETFMCAEANDSLDQCQLLMGPKIEVQQVRQVRFRLYTDVRQFALVAFHDKSMQFGSATFTVSSIRMIDENDQSAC